MPISAAGGADGSHSGEIPPHSVPPRPNRHSGADDRALPAARPHPPSPELRGLAKQNEDGETRRRRLPLFRSRTRQTSSPEFPNQSPGTEKKEIVRATDSALSGPAQPHPVEALTVSLAQIDVALGYLKRSLPPGLADIVDFDDMEAIEDFLAGCAKLIKALEDTGVMEELMAAVASELTGPEGELANADTEESEQRSLLRRLLASPYPRIIALIAIATVLKTAAWYGLPSVSDDTVLASLGLGTLAHPVLRKVAATTAKIFGSWLIALTEYVPFTAATTIADKNDIHLARLRGILQPIDLGAFLGAAALLDHERIETHHLLGFTIAIIGSAFASWPDNELPVFERMLHDATKPDSAVSKTLASLREYTPVLKNRDPRESRGQLRTRKEEALALAKYLDADVTGQLESLKSALQSALASREQAVAACADSEPTEQEAAFIGQLRRVENTLVAARRLSDQLEELAAAAGEQSEQKAKRMKTLFNRAWWIAQGAAATGAVVFMLKEDPLATAVSLSVGATGIKTLAWFKHTTKEEQGLSPEKLTPKDLIARVLYSWRIAFFEYIELTIANSEADVVPVRGAIEAADAVWTTAFLSMVKGSEVKLRQLSGLLLAAFGIWIATR